MDAALEALVIRKSHRLPAMQAPAGDGASAARQFDAALMTAGFKLSGGALERFSAMDPGAVIDTAVRVLATVREMAGDHVQHNAYFIDFPANVPGTVEFWAGCLMDALMVGAEVGGEMTPAGPVVNLLTLPKYGTYQHTYADLLAAHEELIPAAGDRVTVLHAGGELAGEVRALYLRLASSTVPLSDEDMAIVADLALYFASDPGPEVIPVREVRALINRVRLERGLTLHADTVTDVLRAVAAASGGDVSLSEPVKLRSFRRRERAALMVTLETVCMGQPGKLADVGRYSERWKRLAERIHPHEFHRLPLARSVFAVARGEIAAPSIASRAEAAFAAGDPAGACKVLRDAPGMLFRSLDWLLRSAADSGDADGALADTVAAADAQRGRVSGRVLLALREHLQNRTVRTDVSRVFVNQEGRAWAAPDTRKPLDPAALADVLAMLDDEIGARLPAPGHLVIDPAILGVALPLSGKTAPGGLGVLPRGSVCSVNGDVLRFFTYWRETAEMTDFDLSALLLNPDYTYNAQLSWTGLRAVGGVHSGDITSAGSGASEFIDLALPMVQARFIVPQVNVYSGESFADVAESFFGFMSMGAGQKGKPFEPRTVRMKSDLRGAGKVALPMAFMRGDDGKWRGKWMHLYLRGNPNMNRIEANKVSASLLARSIIERDYLRVGYLTGLMRQKAASVTETVPGNVLPGGPVTFVGLEAPEGLPEGCTVYDLPRLPGLIPA